MIAFRVTTDPDYIRGVFTHPDVWPYICEDGHPGPAHFLPLMHETITYLVPELDGVPMGCLMLQAMGSVVIELHTALLPAYRGKHTLDVFRALVAYLPGHFSATYLRTWVPSYNRPALLAAKRVGFIERGIEPSAYLKNGALCDNHLFGVTL